MLSEKILHQYFIFKVNEYLAKYPVNISNVYMLSLPISSKNEQKNHDDDRPFNIYAILFLVFLVMATRETITVHEIQSGNRQSGQQCR